MVQIDNKSYWRDPLIAFGRMSGWVVGPILLALIVGKWLDVKYHSTPFLFLTCTAFAFLISISGLIKETKKYLKNIKKNETPNTNDSNSTTN